MLPAAAAIQSFLLSAGKPALLEPGEPLLPLLPDMFLSEERASHVLLQAWDERRNIVRRVTGVREHTRGKLTLTVQRFANRPGELVLVDLAAPSHQGWARRGSKLVFRERFRQFLAREFADWNLVDVSAEADLEHSLSPTFPRAFLRRGKQGFAAIAAGPETGDASGLLTFGLIWLDYLRRREPRVTVEGLVMLLPAGQERPTSLRVPYLTGARFEIFTYAENDHAVRLDPGDSGNLVSALEPCRRPSDPNVLRSQSDTLDAVEGFERVEQADGTASLRIHGLEFARLPGRETQSELLAHARQLSRMRGEHGSQLYRKEAERWLESQVRQSIFAVDAALCSAPIYGQVPAFAAGERGIIDLLAVEYSGRLAVLELKAAADIHLPLQALDYWMRVAHHASEFSAKGYFPGVVVRASKPRLILVAPSLEFHASTEAVLRFFSPEIEVVRIGLAAAWRQRVHVMFQLCGSSTA